MARAVTYRQDPDPTPSDSRLDQLFRTEGGRVIGRLARQLGPGRLDLAEDAVARALVAAARLWRIRGLPSDPAAGLYRIAWNKAADLLREEPGDAEPLGGPAVAAWPSAQRGMDDDLLSLVFLCSHPALPEAARITLTLKAALGFSIAEIGVSLRDTDMAVAERLSQGRRTVRERALPLELPAGRALLPRLSGVLATIHLAFSEAYASAQGERAVRAEICTELVRLARGLADHPSTGTPTAHALAALMLLQAARLPAIGDAGEVALLADPDRRRWDRHLTAIGLHHLERAASGGTLSAYHLEAGIAAEHAVAPSHAAADWPTIRGYYDALIRLRPTPEVRLNRAVAVAETDGPAAGLQVLAGLQSEPRLAVGPYLSAAAAEFLARLGRGEAAAEAFGRAIALARTLPERRLLQRRLDALAMPAGSL